MATIISGSIAFDSIMNFEDEFSKHIIPDKIDTLNLSFLVPRMRQEFGGCAGNISYNLRKLGGKPIVLGSVGKDFSPYADWMDENEINRDYINECKNLFSARAFIITDCVGNQITAFHPGAMENIERYPISKIKADLAIVSPDSKTAMLENSKQLAEANVPFVFDPGQGTPMFTGDELIYLIELSNWVIVNEYESKLIEDKTSLSPAQIAKKVTAYIVTMGDRGSEIFVNSKKITIDAVGCDSPIDPTGCGDAFRAGFLFGLEKEWPILDAARLGSVLGAIKVGTAGTQNHVLSKELIEDYLNQNYQLTLD